MCSEYDNYFKLDNQHVGDDLYDRPTSTRVFGLTVNRIYSYELQKLWEIDYGLDLDVLPILNESCVSYPRRKWDVWKSSLEGSGTHLPYNAYPN